MRLIVVKVSTKTAWHAGKYRQKFPLLMNPKCLYTHQAFMQEPLRIIKIHEDFKQRRELVNEALKR